MKSGVGGRALCEHSGCGSDSHHAMDPQPGASLLPMRTLGPERRSGASRRPHARLPRRITPIAADLFLYPDLTQPAFGLVGAEALACGVPVIGARHGAIPEVLGEEETLFAPGDAKDLREKIATALDDLPRLGHRLGPAGSRRAPILKREDALLHA